jgi:hypothetical protein
MRSNTNVVEKIQKKLNLRSSYYLKAAAVGDRRETGAGVRLVTTAGIGALPTPGRFKAMQSTAHLAESLVQYKTFNNLWLIGYLNFKIFIRVP